MIWITLTILLTIISSISLYYLFKFAKLILILEDDFSETVEALKTIEENLNKILNMQLFFDNKEVRSVVEKVLRAVKQDKIIISKLVQKFVERSKRKYVVEIEEEDPVLKKLFEQHMIENRNISEDQF